MIFLTASSPLTLEQLVISRMVWFSLISIASSSCVAPVSVLPSPTALKNCSCPENRTRNGTRDGAAVVAKPIPILPTVRGTVASEPNLTTLKHVQIFFRHGDRSPLFDFPNNPVNISETWPLGLGQLTSKGKRQAHELGRFIRKRYSGFIREEFHPDEIYVTSSDFDRTIMSALSVLSGLYLPHSKSWDPVPLRTLPPHLDNVLSFQKPCPAYKAELDRMSLQGEAKIFDRKNKDYYDFIATHTGLSNITFSTISELFDTIYIQHQHGFPLPEWAKKPLVGREPFMMRRTAEYIFSMLTSTKLAMNLRASPILKEILLNVDRFRRDSGRNSTENGVIRKMLLYSGHDSTLSTLLQVFGVYEPLLVPYSAALIVELHQAVVDVDKDQTKSGCRSPKMDSSRDRNDAGYFIKILYQNCSSKPALELFIPNCGFKNKTSNSSNSNCGLSELRTLKKELLGLNWDRECYRGHKGSQCPYHEGIGPYSPVHFDTGNVDEPSKRMTSLCRCQKMLCRLIVPRLLARIAPKLCPEHLLAIS